MTTWDRVTAVIVNWNSSKDTLAVTDRLLSQYPELRVLVVDNASEQDQVELLKSGLQDLRASVVLRPVNGGYAAGVNEAMSVARANETDWYWLINPDARPQHGCLPRLLEHSQGAVAVGPRQFTSRAEHEPATSYVSAVEIADGRARGLKCEGCSDGVHPVSVLTGTGIILNAHAVARTGPMREEFFHYKEEFEFIERLARLGKILYVCNAVVWHERGASLSQASPSAQYYRVRNEFLYLSMRSSRWRLTPRTARLVLRTVASAIFAPSSQHRSMTMRALADGFRARGGQVRHQ